MALAMKDVLTSDPFTLTTSATVADEVCGWAAPVEEVGAALEAVVDRDIHPVAAIQRALEEETDTVAVVGTRVSAGSRDCVPVGRRCSSCTTRGTLSPSYRRCRATMRRHRLAVLLLAFVLVACGDDDGGGAQPLPGTDEFVDAAFDDLPRYPGSESLAPISVESGVINQTFAAETTPAAVVDWYLEELDEWTLVEDPSPVDGAGVWADLTRRIDGELRRLRITAVATGGDEELEGGHVQYDVTLYPDASLRPAPGSE